MTAICTCIGHLRGNMLWYYHSFARPTVVVGPDESVGPPQLRLLERSAKRTWQVMFGLFHFILLPPRINKSVQFTHSSSSLVNLCTSKTIGTMSVLGILVGDGCQQDTPGKHGKLNTNGFNGKLNTESIFPSGHQHCHTNKPTGSTVHTRRMC